MKIVIDIPDEEYERIQAMDWKNGDRLYPYETIAIHNGTQLPKGHGRLIDADDLVRFISHHAYPIRYDCNSIEQGMSITGINQCINESPTIIEADKEG